MDLDRINNWLQTGYMDFHETTEIRRDIEDLIDTYQQLVSDHTDSIASRIQNLEERIKKANITLQKIEKERKKIEESVFCKDLEIKHLRNLVKSYETKQS